MGFNNIEKKNFWYSFFLKLFVAPWFNYVFYRKVSVNNIGLIPKDGMLIFTPNHQNALIDAMAPLCNIDKQLVFLARADIFKKKSIARILYFLKILPIFRIRDGYSEVKRNDLILSKTIDVLKSGNGIVIFPEGSHEWKHKLRPFKKGHARMAFQTAVATEFKQELKIVPVGLNYSDYSRIRSDITINIGQPIMVSQFYSLYKESPAKAIHALNEKLYDQLSPLILNICDDEDYEMIDFLTDFYSEKIVQRIGLKSNKGFDKFQSQKETIRMVEKAKSEDSTAYKELKAVYTIYCLLLKKSKVKNNFPSDSQLTFVNILHNMFILAVGLPFFLYGFINNILPWIVTILVTQKVKDVTFKSSFAYVASLLIFPVFYFLQLLFLNLFFMPWWLLLIYIVSLPFSAAFSLDYWLYFKKYSVKLKWMLFKFKQPKLFQDIQTARTKLFSCLDNFQL